MNTLPPSNAAWHPTLPSNTSQPVAVSSLQTQHAHPVTLELSNLSHNATLALSQIENQPSDGAQLTTHEQQEYVKKTREVALQTRIGIYDKVLSLVASHENADAHYQKTDAYYQQTVFLSEKDFAYATLTVRVRLNERDKYDLVSIERQEQSPDDCISIVVPGPSQPANTYAPTPQGASSLNAQHAQGQLAQARINSSIPPSASTVHHNANKKRKAPSFIPEQSPPAKKTVEDKKVRRRSITLEDIAEHIQVENGKPGKTKTLKELAASLYETKSFKSFGKLPGLRREYLDKPDPGRRASSPEIENFLYSDVDKTELRNIREIHTALVAAGLSAGWDRIGPVLIRAKGEKSKPPGGAE